MEEKPAQINNHALEEMILKAGIAAARCATALVTGAGLFGAIFFIMAYIFIKFGTEAQKVEFIDLYFLQKWAGRPIYSWAIPMIFVGFVLFQRYYYQRKIAVHVAEITRLGGAKSQNQSKKLGRKLNSTTTKPKRRK